MPKRKVTKEKGQQQQSRFLRFGKGQARNPPATAQGKDPAARLLHPHRTRFYDCYLLVRIYGNQL